MIKRSKTTSPNKKIRNATPCEMDGIKFRSKLELFTYKVLKEQNIDSEYEQNRYFLMESFRYEGKIQRAITYTPDFVGVDYIIECKGYGNDTWPIKRKLFLKHLLDNNIDKKFYVVKNQKEVHEAVLLILKNRDEKGI